jgi:hypothetical protein
MPSPVDAVVRRAAENTALPNWFPPGLAGGYAGVALLHLYTGRAAADAKEAESGRLAAFDFIRAAVAATERTPLRNPGVFSGTAGLALALADCARDEPRFGPSLAALHQRLAAQVLATAWPRSTGHVSVSHYDTVSGAAGILGYLCSIPAPSPEVHAAVDHVLDYLVWLGEPGHDPAAPRRWLIAPHLLGQADHQKLYPYGYLNLGMAHGMPGVAAALAVAWRAGHRRPGLWEALDNITKWIQESCDADEFGRRWPNGMPVDHTGAQRSPDPYQDRLAWCYGTPGVSAALLTVAEVTGDTKVRNAAMEGFEAALRRLSVSTVPLTAGLCHGVSGLLVICEEFAAAGSTHARTALPRLADTTRGYADFSRPLVFTSPGPTGGTADDATFITGAPGVALALLARAGDIRPAWFSTLLVR